MVKRAVNDSKKMHEALRLLAIFLIQLQCNTKLGECVILIGAAGATYTGSVGNGISWKQLFPVNDYGLIDE